MAKLVIADEPDDEQLLSAYQSMTVLARLVWERPYDPKLAGAAAPRPVPDAAAVGRRTTGSCRRPTARRTRSTCRRREWKLIPDCGHLPMFEKEAEFVEAVRRFGLA